MRPVPFKYTFSVAKAEQREDGMFLVGEASGPEIDATNERMSPQAIQRFAEQIESMATAGRPLAYRDAHAQDGVMRDLGEVTRAWIDEEMHLGVEVKLDEDSPAAIFLFKQINKGKQFGMSIAGNVLDFVDEFAAEIGRVVRTYLDIMLTEISNTTRPAWTPSFGTVLSKAIDEATAESIATQGENVDPKKDALAAGDSTEATAEDVAKEAETVEETEDVTEKATETVEETVAETEGGEPTTTDTEKTDETEADADVEKASDETADAESDTTSTATETEKTDETPAADEEQETEATEKAAEEDESGDEVEKAGRSISAANAKRLLAMYAYMTSEMKAMGLIDEVEAPAKSDSTDAETALTKALDEATVEKAALEARVTELQQDLTEKTARITELENMPVQPAPNLVTRADEAEEARKAIASMGPSEKLRAGLSLVHAS